LQRLALNYSLTSNGWSRIVEMFAPNEERYPACNRVRGGAVAADQVGHVEAGNGAT